MANGKSRSESTSCQIGSPPSEILERQGLVIFDNVIPEDIHDLDSNTLEEDNKDNHIKAVKKSGRGSDHAAGPASTPCPNSRTAFMGMPRQEQINYRTVTRNSIPAAKISAGCHWNLILVVFYLANALSICTLKYEINEHARFFNSNVLIYD